MTLHNMTRVVSATTGTGAIALGAAVSGFFTFGGASVADGEVVTYMAAQSGACEVGRGTYATSGAVLTRTTILNSNNSGNAIDLDGTEEVFISLAAEDLSGRKQLIQEIAPSTTTVVFSSIPQYYNHLQIEWIARSASTAADTEYITIKVNSDATNSNYRYCRWESSYVVNGYGGGGDYRNVGRISAGTAYTYSCGVGRIFIPYYTGTTFKKQMHNFSTCRGNGNANSEQFVAAFGMEWENTAPISDLTIDTTSGGNFVTGSKFRLYGVY